MICGISTSYRKTYFKNIFFWQKVYKRSLYTYRLHSLRFSFKNICGNTASAQRAHLRHGFKPTVRGGVPSKTAHLRHCFQSTINIAHKLRIDRREKPFAVSHLKSQHNILRDNSGRACICFCIVSGFCHYLYVPPVAIEALHHATENYSMG